MMGPGRAAYPMPVFPGEGRPGAERRPRGSARPRSGRTSTV